MLWCPKCKTEYRDGFTTCSDCNSELVNEIVDDNIKDDYIHSSSLLITVSDNFFAQSIEDLLKSNDIPVYVKSDQSLEVIMGASNNNKNEIFVPDIFIDNSKLLIEEELDYKFGHDENNFENDTSDNQLKNNVKKRSWFLLWILYIPGGILFVFLLLFMIYSLIYD